MRKGVGGCKSSFLIFFFVENNILSNLKLQMLQDINFHFNGLNHLINIQFYAKHKLEINLKSFIIGSKNSKYGW